jgi:hypothetical protein
MTGEDSEHEYSIGEAVLAHVGNTPVPGVVEQVEGGRVLVRLSDTWADSTGRDSDEIWLTPDLLDPSIDTETGGEQALPG